MAHPNPISGIRQICGLGIFAALGLAQPTLAEEPKQSTAPVEQRSTTSTTQPQPPAKVTESETQGLPRPQVAVGASVGFTLNGDQFVTGPHAELQRVLLNNLALGLPLLFGWLDDYLTIRPSLQLQYYFRIADFWIQPLVGFSVQGYLPVGKFAKFCNQYNVDCGGVEVGPELGGGIGYRWIGADVYAGLSGVPALTARAKFTYTFGEEDRP